MAASRPRRFPFGITTIVLMILLAAVPSEGQEPEEGEMPSAADKVELPERSLPADMVLTKTDEVTIRGERVPYRVTTGTQPVYGEDGEPSPRSSTPTTSAPTSPTSRAGRSFISFNGGPGSASLWMHLGYTSPKLLMIDDEGFPVQPYGVRDNPHSILDVADIVYVNPVNTGFSRILDDEIDREQFFGVKEDIAYLADWIDVFVSRHGRWRSPKYLIGESYGTTRVSGLAGALQDRHWMYLNGVILVSPTGLGMDAEGPAPRSPVLKLPVLRGRGLLPRPARAASCRAATSTSSWPRSRRSPSTSTCRPSRGAASWPTSGGSEIARQVARYAGLSEAVRARPQPGGARVRLLEGAAARRGLHHRPARLALPGRRPQGTPASATTTRRS